MLSKLKDTGPLTPCDVSLRPIATGNEVRIFFPDAKAKAGTQLRTLVYQTTAGPVIDVWSESSKSKQKSNAASRRDRETKDPAFTLGSGKRAEKLIDAFEDPASWADLLDAQLSSMEFRSQELDRYRAVVTPDAEALLEIERRALRIPLIDFPIIDRALEFSPEEADWKLIERIDVADTTPPREKLMWEKSRALLKDLVIRGQWPQAREALNILERGTLKAYVPSDHALIWAMKGRISLGLMQQASDGALKREALFEWREGLRKRAGRGGDEAPWVEYMLLESIRLLTEAGQHYAAASLLAWSDRFTFSQRLEERVEFLKAESLYQLGFFAESEEAFRRFFDLYKDKPLNFVADRRLVPFSGARIADQFFRLGQFAKAENALNRVFAESPSLGRFAFENTWYPEEVRIYPQFLVNRSEIRIRLGNLAGALQDLRAFLFVATGNKEVGRVLYRIGELLKRTGASEEAVRAAWRECIFRAPGTLGAKLAEARMAVLDFPKNSKAQWPRLLGVIENVNVQRGDPFYSVIRPDDLSTYSEILAATVFFSVDEPTQALFRLVNGEKLEPTRDLRLWWREYYATAQSGVFQRMLAQGKNEEVIKETERLHRNTFADVARPEFFFYSAQAYSNLNLPVKGQEVFIQAEKLWKKYEREKLRQYDPTPADWQFLWARLAVQRLQNQPELRPEAEKAMTALSSNEERVINLWLAYLERIDDLRRAPSYWKKLESLRGLDWSEVLRFSRVLERNKQSSEAAQLLERRVGVWFAERGRTASSAPPPALVFALFESRRQNPAQAQAALAVVDYLLTLKKEDLSLHVTPALLEYRKGQILKSLGRKSDARQSFETSMRLEPDSVWAKLSSAEAKELK